jgi:AAA+ ATPase superfamily predicted ATPase
MKKFVGRKNEIATFNACATDNQSHFIAVYGRRRVGKTFLIRHIFKDKFTFYTTGLAKGTLKEQLTVFSMSIKDSFGGEIVTIPNTWIEAFRLLIEHLEASSDTKKIVFIDELPWMDQRNSSFMTAFEYFWNSWASRRFDILLIVCGSSASWMINKLIKNKGGLHNRVTLRIKLNPFTLKETNEYLNAIGCQYDYTQCIETYMCFGGIPYYLSLFNKDWSATQNINYLCFSENAPLKNEYRIIVQSLFDHPENHLSILESIGTKNKGLQRSEIVSLSRVSDGGGLTRILIELEESGFIRKYNNFNKKSREVIYQLTDAFTIFHQNFLVAPKFNDANTWLNLINTPVYNTWSGYAFEIVCLNHATEIKKALGIEGILTNISSWKNQNAQIDLVIDRADKVINLVEIKYAQAAYLITKNYDQNLRNKIAEFKEATKTRKAVWLVMLTSFGLKNGPYNGIAQKSLNAEVLFGN